MNTQQGLVRALALVLAASSVGCARGAAVQTAPTLPLRRVVVYRNGVGYFERQGRVREREVNFRVAPSEVGDFLATLAVMEQGGSSVRSAAASARKKPGRARVAACAKTSRRSVRWSAGSDSKVARESTMALSDPLAARAHAARPRVGAARAGRRGLKP